MAKALKVVAVVAGVAALALVTGGAAVGLGVSLGTSIIGTGITAGALLLVSTVASTAAALLTKGPQVPTAQTDRLNVSIDPRAFRKTVLGQTAFPTDIRYEEWSGTDQEYCDWIVALASHAIDGVEEIWLNTEMVWSQTTAVVGRYAGYFSVPNIILEGSADNAFSFASGRWNGAARLTGCAYLRLRFKVTGNSKKAESPFASGIPSRITIIGRGAKLYDPRRDSTVPGGSGPMRAGDQSTWRYTTDDGVTIGENLPLQILRVVLGWRIRNPVTGEMRLATGSGVPAKRLLLASWITAANLADEQVNRSAGGTEPRYHGAGVVSEGEEPRVSLDAMCAACCARFRDTGGKLSIAIAHNDLANAATDDGLTDDDVIGGFTWDPDPSLAATPNVIRGRYVDATTASLYQLIDYPEVRLASPDGQDRIFPLDLGVVESPSHAQRVAKQVLQRKQYQREFTAPFDIRAWKYTVGDVLPFTFAPLSFARALFRVKEQELGQGGTCNMTLSVENAQIYAFDRDDAAPVLAAEAVVYDASRNPLILAIDEAAENALRASSDGWLSPAEKRRAVIDFADLVSQRDTLTAKWTELGSPVAVTDARNAAHARLADLADYLRTLTPAWDDASVSTPLPDPALYRARWTNAASALNAFAAAITGRPGRNALTAYLTNANHTLPARFDGTVTSYAGAESVFVVADGATDLTDSGQFALSVIDNPQGLTIAISGRYFRIDGGLDPSEDIASVTVRLTGSGQYEGVAIDQVFSLAKSKGGADGSPPALISLSASAFTARYDTAGVLVPGQAVTFGAKRQNTAARTVFTLRNSAGTAVHGPYYPDDFARLGGSTFWSAVDADTITLTEAGIVAVIRDHGGATGRVTMIASIEGTAVADAVSLQKVQDGAKGADGTSPYNAILSNESHTLPADAAGNVLSYAGAEFTVTIFYGSTDVTGSFVLEGSDNPQGLAGENLYPRFTVTSGFDASEASANVTYRFIGRQGTPHAGIRLVKVFSLAKSIGGAGGAPAALISLSASALTARYDTAGVLVPGQAVTFGAKKQNTSARTVFTLRNSAGSIVHGPYYADDFARFGGTTFWSAVDADTITLTEAGIVAVIRDHGGTTGRVTMIASIEGTALTDAVSLQKIQDGAKGADGRNAISAILTNETHTLPADPAGNITSYAGAFTYLNPYDGTDMNGDGGEWAYSVVGNPQGLTVGNSGRYFEVTGGFDANEPTASLTLRVAGKPGTRYAGVVIDKVFGLAKSKDGSKGADGVNPPLVSVSANPQVIRYDKDGNYSAGPVTFTAVLVNAIGPVAWRSLIGHGIYNTPGVTFSGNSMTLSPERMRDVLAYNEAYVGPATETIVASASGVSDQVTVTKIRDGAKGADSTVPGPAGNDGYSLIASPAAFVIPSFSNGTSKPAWTGGSCRIALIKGGQEVAADAYSYVSVSNISSIAMSGQSVTFADVVGDKGEFTARATRAGVNYDLRVTVVRTKDGSAAFRSETGFYADSGSVVGSASTTVPGNKTVIVTAGASYGAPNDREGYGNIDLYWRNVTDNGPYNFLGTQRGSLAYTYNRSNIPGEPDYERQFGSVNISRSFTSPTPDKQIEYQARYYTTNGQTSTINGSVALEVTA